MPNSEIMATCGENRKRREFSAGKRKDQWPEVLAEGRKGQGSHPCEESVLYSIIVGKP